MKSLTICFCTSRKEPRFKWFLQSLRSQVTETDRIDIIIVDYYANNPDFVFRKEIVEDEFGALFMVHPLVTLRHVEPKPTIWQGKHQITKVPWWAKSNSLNTSVILCKTDWWSWTDDRSVLAPTWLNAIRRAMDGDYAVCGSYEKHAGLVVDGGVVQASKEILGVDTRSPGLRPFDSFYGGSGALPLEWCLAVQGFSEDLCDGLSSEDSMFGVCLRNSGFPIMYDSSMRIIEDRTPSEIGGALKRADKNKTPEFQQRAKSWDIVRAFHGKTTSQNSYDIRNVRDRVLLNNESLDSIKPSASHIDWYDGSPLAEAE